MVDMDLATALLPPGSIDCNVHHPNPSMQQLMPFLSKLWQDLIASRAIGQLGTIAYPNRAR